MEDRGLWEKGEVAIQRLEARAFSEFKGRKATASRRRMQGMIGEINRESQEIEQKMSDDSDYPVSVDGIEQKKKAEEKQHEKTNPTSRFSNFISSSIEKSANRREERRKKLALQKSKPSLPFEDDNNSTWAVPVGTQRKVIFCEICSTYNDAESNYCSSCGSHIA